MSKYINKRIYTDVESYLITEIDEIKGTAMAIEVEKKITPKMIPGLNHNQTNRSKTI